VENQKTRRIENVATLDLREATEAALADILSIGNVAVVLYSPETAHLVSRVSMGNVASVVEAPADAKILSGQEIWGRDSFKHRTTPLSLVLSGQLIIHPDIPEADLEQGVGEMIVSGQILCPDHLAGIIQPKIRILNGQIQTYRAGAKLQIGSLVLDENYLRALGEASELVVIGKLTAPEILPNDLLEQKVKRIQVIGKLVCREENAPVLLSRLEDLVKSSVVIIPGGFTWIERSVVLDAGMLESLPSNKLYCGGRVQFGEDVEAQLLDGALEKLVVKDVLLAPARLRSVLARKCNLLETQAIFYSGELWLVESEMTLLASRFNYLEGKATLVVQGELMVDSEVEPKLLAERLEKVHNFGEIFCTREQMSALQARLGINEGEFLDVAGEDEAQGSMGNVAYLKL
jgi:hypothetical protein